MIVMATIAGRDDPRPRWLQPRSPARRVVVAAVVGVLLTGCSGGSTAEVNPSANPGTSPAVTTGPSPTTHQAPTPSAPRATAEPIEFRYASHEAPCPPALEFDSLPSTAEHQYVLDREHSSDRSELYILELCSYQRADLRDNEDLVVEEEHVQISSQLRLYREPADVPSYLKVLPPLWSRSLDDWAELMYARRELEAFREGCGEPLRVCAEGEDPAVEVHAHQNGFQGHIGNLNFQVWVSYLGERLPADVEQRNIEIFREFVLTIVESKERVEQ